jgi:hypothetical protein
MAMDEQPYTIESPTRIRLSQTAKYWGEQHGLSLEELARFLLNREKVEEESYG